MKRLNVSAKLMALTLLFLLLLSPMQTFAQEPEMDWVDGPATVELGNDVAQIELGEDYIFTDGEGTRSLMEAFGNPPTDSEVGLIAPKAEDAAWFIVFEYAPIGYVSDDEKDNIDAAAILDSIKAGTEEANKIREENGFSPLNLIGWYEEPNYDSKTNNLVWTLLAEDGGDEVVNYNVRLLGRHGYISAVLVTDPPTLDTYKLEVEKILANFSYKEGKRYAEFSAGDNVAEYGLTALIAGGAGAAAAKSGLLKTLAKFSKVILVAIFAFFAAIWGKVKSVFSGSKSDSITLNKD